ncbi:MAG: 2-amino-4-hydroxy-6-hydroxymethyldihydropteridine diphosphokinase [Gaiellaceae bacterium MAG52_C11]|nr:2-amino-4-hydroxy-6-hydroxymethyldihydropteridine diphosphokinase [Candidatus Gaiellasilicea maunaloa]
MEALITTAFIGIGSNQGRSRQTIERALALLGEHESIRVAAISSLRETDPVGYLDQPRFLNGAARLETELSARELLVALLDVERALGRVRDGPRFGPRAIDLDVLLYGEVTIDELGLTVPHPRLHERRFALEPLHELEPGLVVPGRGSVAALLSKLH